MTDPGSGERVAPLEVDRESLLELARGSNLYRSRFEFVRELVQNAVDATLLRVYAERGKERFPTNEGSMRDLRALLADYPIDVTIERTRGEAQDEERSYRVVIEDRGIGISRADLPHLQRIGSSHKNPGRAAMIEEMPEWMRPSGTFGIGLQSVFLVSDELRLSSRSAGGDAVDVLMTKRGEGQIEVRDGERAEVGTRAEVELDFRRVSFEAYLNGDGGDEWDDRPGLRLFESEHLEFDSLRPEEDLPLGGALALVRCMGTAVVPLRLNGRAVLPSWLSQGWFDERTGVEIWLPTEDQHADEPLGRRRFLARAAQGIRHFYRGAPLDGRSVGLLPRVGWGWNLHFGTARELVTLARDGLTASGEAVARKRLIHALARRLPSVLPELDPAGRCALWYSRHLAAHPIDGGRDASTIPIGPLAYEHDQPSRSDSPKVERPRDEGSDRDRRAVPEQRAPNRALKRVEVSPLEVDRESLLELVRGGNLYPSKLAFLRELVQNAVDATLLRVFAEQGRDAFPTYEGSLRDLRSLLNDYPVDVTVKPIRDHAHEAEITYRVSIEDRGSGIHRADLPHLQRIGSSRKNPRRAQLIRDMPEWMRPSGAFGIGLQSVFLVTDEVHLSTRSADPEPLELVLSRRDGGMVRARDGERREIGTMVELQLTLRRETARPDANRDLDPNLTTRGPFEYHADRELGAAVEHVRLLGLTSLVPIRLNGVRIESPGSPQTWFDPKTLIELWLPGADDDVLDPSHPCWPDVRSRPDREPVRTFYRGAPTARSELGTTGTPLMHMPWHCNLHYGSARRLLRLSRYQLTEPGDYELRRRLLSLLRRRLPTLVAELGPESRRAAWYSLYLFAHGREGAGHAWRQIPLGFCGSPGSFTPSRVTLGTAAELDSYELLAPLSGYDETRLPTGEELELVGTIREHRLALRRLFPGLSIEEGHLHYSRRASRHIDEASAERSLLNNCFGLFPGYRGEVMMPTSFERLRVPDWVCPWSGEPRRFPTQTGPWMVLKDGRVTTPHLLELVADTAKKRGEGPGAYRDIAAEWARFLVRFDPIVRQREDLTMDYELQDALDTLDAIGR